MDSKGRQLRAGLAVVFAAAFALFSGIWVNGVFAQENAAQSPLNLHEASWLAPEGRFEALFYEPVTHSEVLLKAAIANGDSVQDVLTGEALFKAPLMLGGQAAKAGLSCQSCHVNGRDNPHFQFAAISDEPGTADTTHSFFSKTLGNQIFDPVPIPDLTQPGKVDHNPSSRALEEFITTIVVEEFSGSSDMEEVIGPLAAYIRALRASGAAAKPTYRPRDVTRDLANVLQTGQQAQLRMDAGQRRSAALLLSSAQSQLRMMYERMVPGRHDKHRLWLVERSREAGAMRQALDSGQVVAEEAITQWHNGLQSPPDFAAVKAETLYNRDILKPVLAR